jgi:hypothetical protein
MLIWRARGDWMGDIPNTRTWTRSLPQLFFGPLLILLDYMQGVLVLLI